MRWGEVMDERWMLKRAAAAALGGKAVYYI